MLEQELKVFNEHKAQLLSENPSGGFAVIKGDEILGVWVSRVDALKEGIEHYGNVAFLIKDINESDSVINFTRNLQFA